MKSIKETIAVRERVPEADKLRHVIQNSFAEYEREKRSESIRIGKTRKSQQQRSTIEQ